MFACINNRSCSVHGMNVGVCVVDAFTAFPFVAVVIAYIGCLLLWSLLLIILFMCWCVCVCSFYTLSGSRYNHFFRFFSFLILPFFPFSIYDNIVNFTCERNCFSILFYSAHSLRPGVFLSFHFLLLCMCIIIIIILLFASYISIDCRRFHYCILHIDL